MAESLPERTPPELAYPETKFAALASYGLTLKWLEEVLPIGQALSTRTIRRQVHQAAERLETELVQGSDPFLEASPPDESAPSTPATPLVVSLDGCYVHAAGQRSRTEGWFEVIVGKPKFRSIEATPHEKPKDSEFFELQGGFFYAKSRERYGNYRAQTRRFWCQRGEKGAVLATFCGQIARFSRESGFFARKSGKSLATEDRAAKCFGFVSRYDPEPKRRLSAWLDGQALQEGQPVTFRLGRWRHRL